MFNKQIYKLDVSFHDCIKLLHVLQKHLLDKTNLLLQKLRK